ncbi:MAG: YadA-like family protein [Veillonella sp.]|nr:YadA-like family protein [Veillonella sp.]
MNNEKELVRPGGLTSVSSGSGKQIKKQRNVITRICALAAVGVFLGTGAGVQATTTQAINNVTDNDAGPTLSINGNIATSVAEAQALDSSVTALNYADQNIIMGEGSFVANQNFDDDGKSVVIGASSFVSTKPFGTFVSSGGTAGYNAGGQGVVVGSSSVATSQAVAVGGNVYAVGRSSIALGSDDNQAYKNTITQYDYENYFKNLYKYIDADGHTYGYYSGDASVTNKENTASRIYSPTLAQGNGSISIGSRSLAYADGTTALGTLAFALGQGSTAVGTQTRAQGVGSIAIGSKSYVFTDNSIAAGNRTQITGDGSAAYGYRAAAVGDNSQSIGAYSLAYGLNSTAVGVAAHSLGKNSLAVGVATSSVGNNSTTVGAGSVNYGSDSAIFGATSDVWQTSRNVALFGVNSTVKGANILALGNNIRVVDGAANGVATNDTDLYSSTNTNTKDIVAAGNQVAVGYNVSDSVVIGRKSSLGDYSFVNPSGDDASQQYVKVNSDGTTTANSSGTDPAYVAQNIQRSLVLGSDSHLLDNSTNTLVLGSASIARGTNNILVGNQSRLMGASSSAVSARNVILGNQTVVDSGVTDSMVLGTGASIGSYALSSDGTTYNKIDQYGKATAVASGTSVENQKAYITKAVAIGNNAHVLNLTGQDYTSDTASQTDAALKSGYQAMAIGANSVAYLRNSVALGVGSITDYTADNFAAAGWMPPDSDNLYNLTSTSKGIISVGSKGGERRITNVAAGAIDSDAVNVSQLKALYYNIQAGFANLNQGNAQHYMSINQSGDAATLANSLKKQTNYDNYVTKKSQYLQYVARKTINGESFSQTALDNMKATITSIEQANPDFVTTASQLNAIDPNTWTSSSNINTTLQTITTAQNSDAAETVNTGVSDAELAASNYKNNGAQGANSIAFGYQAGTDSTAANSVAIGSGSQVTAADVASDKKGYLQGTNAGSTWQQNDGVVSFGNTTTSNNTTTNHTRRLIHVAAGSDDTDAVNVAQLRVVANAVGMDAPKDPTNTTPGVPASNDTSSSGNGGSTTTVTGPAGHDGTNGTTMTNKIQALRDGTAGTLVYTDGNGNRLLSEGGKYYNTALVSGKVKANNGLWYNSADVNSDGSLVDPTNTNGQTLAQLNEAATTSQSVDPSKVVLSAVNPDGTTTAPTAIKNVASVLGINPTGTGDDTDTVTNLNSNPIGEAKAQTLTNNLLGMSGAALNQVTTAADLQAVAQAGLDFTGNMTSTGSTTASDVTVHRALGSTLKIIGADTTANGLASTASSYSAKNLATIVDTTNNTIQVVMKKVPDFDAIHIGSGTITIEAGSDNGNTLTLRQYDPSTGQPINNAIAINGLTTGDDASSIATKGYVDGLMGNGATSVPSSGSAGDLGPASQDNMANNGIINQLDGIRSGLAGTMVYTDKAGDRLIHQNGNFYKASAFAGRRYLTADNADLNGKPAGWYNTSDMTYDSATSKWKFNTGTTPTALSDADIAAAKVATNDIVISSVHPDGSTTTTTPIYNVQSALGINPAGTTNAATDLNNAAITSDKAKTLINGDNATTPTAGSLLGKSGTALNQVTTVGDLQAVAQAGLDFTGNLNVNNSTTDGATMTHQALGSALNIIGAADSAHGLLTSTNSYDASNLATVVDPTNHQVQVVMKKAPTFSGLKVGDASFTFTKDPNTDTWTIKPYDVATNTTGSNQVSIDGMTTGSTPSSLVTKDYVDKLIGGGSSTNNGGSDNSGSGTNGASGNDGQNGNSLVNKVQSLRDGTSGTMVYTDKAGDRLLAENGLYYKPALVDGLKQGIDGRWYPADDLDSNGIPKSGTESDGKTLKELNDAATTKQDVPANTVVMSAVNPDGTTKTPTTIRNVASVLGIDPTGTGDDTDTVTNLNSEPIGQAKAQTLTNNLLSMKGDDLTQAVTAGDLQAVAQAGLDFGTNQGGTIHRALGSTLSIKGAEDNTNSANFDASNVMTWTDGNVIRIGTTKTPKFDSIQFNGNGQNGSNPVTMTTDGNGNIIVKNGSEQVRLATMNDGIYVADGNNNTKLVKLGEKVTFNKNMDVSFSDATTANASNTGTTNGSTSGSTSSGSSDTGSATSGSTATTGTTTAPSDARATVDVSSTPTFDSVTVNKAVDSNSAGNTLVTKTYVDTNVKTVSDAINNISNSLGKGTIGTGNDTDNGTVSGATVKNYLDANYATRGEMNGRLSEISNDSSAGTAAALAAATIPQITNLQQGKVLIGAGMGGYRGQSALAVGVSGVLNNRDVTYKLAGTFDSQNHWGWSAGIGIAVGTGGDVPSVTEGTTTVVDTKTLSTINDKMAKLEAENKAIKEKNEALQKRMDEILAKLNAK